MASKTLPRAGDFLLGGGLMGELIRSKDWSGTPLGPIDEWPQSLRTTVSLCLASNFPINLIWGPEHIQIYNDGYQPICAAKHPQSLGENYTKTWASAWDNLDEAFQRAMAGQTSYLENQRMFLDRNGYLEETFFTFSLSPIRDESGEIGGLFHPVTETTAQMLSQRRTRALQEIASRPAHARSVDEACSLAMQALSEHQLDVPFALIYLVDDQGKIARLAGTTHLPPGTEASPQAIDLADQAQVWPLAEALDKGVLELTDLANRFGPLPCGPYAESPAAALVMPIKYAGTDHPGGFLIAGISPRLPFTKEYRAFFDLLSANLTAATVNARAYQEERKRAEKLAELDKAKTEFFSNVSHEFRTPLTLMLGPLEELLSNSGEQFLARREMVELIHRNSLRLLRLVNTLLEFSRIEANRATACFEPVELAGFTADLASLFRSTIEKADLTLDVNCPKLPEGVYVDREMWEKIVLNLISNAFKFTFKGTIGVTIHDLGDKIKLAVSDTGTGIAAQELPNLFQRFHRVKGSAGRSYEGTGIGLALVEDLVKLHGGTVAVNSAVGEGTTFQVIIPKGYKHLPNDQVSHEPSSSGLDKNGSVFVEEALRWSPTTTANTGSKDSTGHPHEPAKARRKRILLADDNADMRQYIREILASEFEVETVSDGAQALRSIQQNAPDLVLTDVMMPELDGFGLLNALRDNPETKGIPCIMLSARAGEEARVMGIESGADDYLVKPFNARELLARVRVTLELARLRWQLSSDEAALIGAGQMQQQWKLFDTALSHTPDSIYIFDSQNRLRYANRTLLERLQQPFSQLLGKNLREIGYAEDIAMVLENQLKQVIHSGAPLRDEATLIDAAGNRTHYSYVFVPVVSKDGSVEAVAGYTRDITSLKETNTALREANADLEQFAFSASHDLQEPLRMVSIYSQLLKKKYGGQLDSQADMIIGRCVDSAVRMEALIRDLLIYTKASTESPVPAEPIALDSVFDRTLENLRTAIEEANASVTRTALPAVHMESVHAQQLLQNLIGNALKYHSDSRPEVHVSAKRQESEWIISVQDNGIGISADYNDQIFGLFKRLHTEGVYSGTGLGLAICKKMVERYGGRIWVESKLGKGSTFLFALPAENEQKLC